MYIKKRLIVIVCQEHSFVMLPRIIVPPFMTNIKKAQSAILLEISFHWITFVF